MKATLNQETMKVSIETLHDGIETVSYTDFYARAFAIEHLSHTGTHKYILTGTEWEQAYLMCDGFGQVDQDFAKEQCWDWSHVRDSSYATIRDVADWIASKHWHLDSIAKIAQQNLDDCVRIGIDPLVGVPGMIGA